MTPSVGVPPVRGGRHGAVAWEVLPPDAALSCPEVIARWGELLAGCPGGQRLYRTPDWFAHATRSCAAGERTALAVARAAGGAVRGLAPLHAGRGSLRFHTAGRTLYRIPFRKLTVLGDQPLLPESGPLYDGLFAALH